MESSALYLEGIAHHRAGRFQDALESYDRALELESNSAATVNSRGVTLIALGRIEHALADFKHAYTLDPSYLEAYLNAAALLRDTGRFEQAVELADQAIAGCPQSGTAWHIKAVALDWLDQREDAIDAYEKALACDDTIELAAGRRIFLAMQSCRWEGLTTATEQILAKVDAGHLASQPFFLLPLPSSLPQQRAAAELFSKKILSSDVSYPFFLRQPGQKIRVGYFSPDLPRPTSHLIAGLIEAHDRAEFEIYGFQYGRETPYDPMSQRLKGAFDVLIPIDMQPNADVARMVRDIRIDIAVHLAGHTSNGRSKIFSPRVAPIQVNYLGFPGTLGMETIDYLIGDDIVIPPEHQQYYSEKIVSLPCYQVNDWKRPFPEGVVARRDLGLPEDAFVFCGFHCAYKITPREFDVWMRLLKRVPGSVLWLMGDSDEITSNLRKEAEARGVAADRLIFAPRVSVSKHLARH